jgi:hypothetical protein
MRILLTSITLLVSISLSYAQGYESQLGTTSNQPSAPVFSVPYIPTRKFDKDATMAKIRAIGAERYAEFKESIDERFATRVLAMDMLPIHKMAFQRNFNRTRSQQDAEMSAYPELFMRKLDDYSRAFDDFSLNPTQIQNAKTIYTRILAWENHIRDKGLLNAPYKGADELTGLTNQQALNILYGQNEDAYLKLKWQ